MDCWTCNASIFERAGDGGGALRHVAQTLPLPRFISRKLHLQTRLFTYYLVHLFFPVSRIYASSTRTYACMRSRYRGVDIGVENTALAALGKGGRSQRNIGRPSCLLTKLADIICRPIYGGRKNLRASEPWRVAHRTCSDILPVDGERQREESWNQYCCITYIASSYVSLVRCLETNQSDNNLPPNPPKNTNVNRRKRQGRDGCLSQPVPPQTPELNKPSNNSDTTKYRKHTTARARRVSSFRRAHPFPRPLVYPTSTDQFL